MTHPFRERGAHPFPVWICYLVIAAGMGILLWFEIGKPTLSADPVLQPISGEMGPCSFDAHDELLLFTQSPARFPSSA